MKKNLITWFDIPVTDLDRSIAFYAAVLEHEVEKQEGPGYAMGIFDHDDDHIGGCLTIHEKAPDGGLGPQIYFSVDGRLDEAVNKATELGGKVLLPKHPLGPYGFKALVADPDGNQIALHSLTD